MRGRVDKAEEKRANAEEKHYVYVNRVSSISVVPKLSCCGVSSKPDTRGLPVSDMTSQTLSPRMTSHVEKTRSSYHFPRPKNTFICPLRGASPVAPQWPQTPLPSHPSVLSTPFFPPSHLGPSTYPGASPNTRSYPPGAWLRLPAGACVPRGGASLPCNAMAARCLARRWAVCLMTQGCEGMVVSEMRVLGSFLSSRLIRSLAPSEMFCNDHGRWGERGSGAESTEGMTHPSNILSVHHIIRPVYYPFTISSVHHTTRLQHYPS